MPRAGRRSNPEPGEKAPGPDRLRCIKPAFTGALCAAGTVTVVSIFLGVLLAYAWRRKDPANQRHYSRQIRYFWRLTAAWGVGFALLVLAIYLKSIAAGPETGHVMVIFGIGLLIAGLGQIWFTAITLFQSLRLTWWPGSA
ncbi:MAG: hypothetical protein EP318_02600 [Rhodobacteraceae bacterium]|nr:MAG: hypothetical protein EP318_02600 [Paracoccaceae bacterium]